ncbi:MAG: endolytic transglycosylase MltG [Firmicutes bacterium]|nr:endolytic transglycosylase MltG [Bacillota bacterium]
MAYLLMAVGIAMALLALWRALAGGEEDSRRRGRSAGAAQGGPGSGAEVAAGLDPGDPRAAAWAVLREPVQVEPGLLDLIARRPPARQFRIGTLLGFGLGLAVAGGIWLLAQSLGWAQSPQVAEAPGLGGQGAAVGEVGGEAPLGHGAGQRAGGNAGGGAAGDTAGGEAPGASASGGDSPTATGEAPENPGGGAAAGPADGGQAQAPAGGGSSGQPGAGGGSTGAAPAPGTLVTVVIDPGMTAPQIAARLREKGLIADEAAFLARLAERGMDTRLQAGTFQIPVGAGLDQVIDRLAGM